MMGTKIVVSSGLAEINTNKKQKILPDTETT